MALARTVRIEDDLLKAAFAGRAHLLMDGAMGTLIQQAELHRVHELPDLLNLTHPDDIVAIQRRYVDAGSDVITANTFNTNALKLEGADITVSEVYAAAAKNARAAGARLVAGDIGPLGTLLEPIGTFTFEEAYAVFAEQARAAADAGCDLLLIETMTDLLETKAAVLACIENTDLPTIASMTFGEDGRTVFGTTPAIAANTLSALGVSAVGINCSLGPAETAGLVREMRPFARCPLFVQPNAGLPHLVDGETVFDVGAEEFAAAMAEVLDAGAVIVGGCCGTTPEHIAKLRELIDGRTPAESGYARPYAVSCAQAMSVLEQGSPDIAVIGERINPTGKKRLRAALTDGDFDYIVGEAVAQQHAGADILDVNTGVPGLDEPAVLTRAVRTLQGTVALPLQLDSSDPVALEAAARIYAGRPMLNSVNGKAASLDEVLPIAAHYGCTVVGLTLDEDGIPSSAEGRFAIARRIVEAAERVGVPREDVAIDCLVMAAATNQHDIPEILRAVTMVKERLGVRTVLGVSNVSFGLPRRPLVNATFLAAAFGAGLDMPILNPLNERYADTVETYRLLNGQDEGCRAFMQRNADRVDPYEADRVSTSTAATSSDAAGAGAAGSGTPANASGAGGTCPIEVPEAFADVPEEVVTFAEMVLSGRKEPVAQITERLLEDHDALAVIDGLFIPVLDEVGLRYEQGRFFLPQLMASAEAVKAGFDIIRARQADAFEGALGAQDGSDASATDGTVETIVVATVEGDIHDIGKNIVKMLLENYGYNVVDLGRDVSPDEVLKAVGEHDAALVGLSALMTTTAPAMERTTQLLHERMPEAKVMVGGAVVTADYARSIGADFYAKDAAASARIAGEVFGRTS